MCHIAIHLETQWPTTTGITRTLSLRKSPPPSYHQHPCALHYLTTENSSFAEPERRQPSSSAPSSNRPPRRPSPHQHHSGISTEPRQRPSQPQKLRPVEDQHRPRANGGYGDGYTSPSGYGSSPSHQPQPHSTPYQQGPPPSHPPPQRYESHAPPQRQGSYGQSAQSRTPQSPAPISSTADTTLLPLFRAVDKRGTGYLTEKELSDALVNGDYTKFDPQTVRMMIRMFDSDENGAINFEEFAGLWGFLAAWRALFDRFDVDGSGGISLDEYSDALVGEFSPWESDGGWRGESVRFCVLTWSSQRSATDSRPGSSLCCFIPTTSTTSSRSRSIYSSSRVSA